MKTTERGGGQDVVVVVVVVVTTIFWGRMAKANTSRLGETIRGEDGNQRYLSRGCMPQ